MSLSRTSSLSPASSSTEFDSNSHSTSSSCVNGFEGGVLGEGVLDANKLCSFDFTDSHSKCSLCKQICSYSRILSCFHRFCQSCLLDKVVSSSSNSEILCSLCHQVTYLSGQSVNSVMSNTWNSVFSTEAQIENQLVESLIFKPEITLTASTLQQPSLSSSMPFMNNSLCLLRNEDESPPHKQPQQQHPPKQLSMLNEEAISAGYSSSKESSFFHTENKVCTSHAGHFFKYFCKKCSVNICSQCLLTEHPIAEHECIPLTNEDNAHEIDKIKSLIQTVQLKISELNSSLKLMDNFSNRIQLNYHKAQHEISETATHFHNMIEERKFEALKELENTYSSKINSYTSISTKFRELADRSIQNTEVLDSVLRNSSKSEIFEMKNFLDNRVQWILGINSEIISKPSLFDFEFISNYHAIQSAVKSAFGYTHCSLNESKVNALSGITKSENGRSKNSSNYFPNYTYYKPLTDSDSSLSSYSSSTEKWPSRISKNQEVFSSSGSDMKMFFTSSSNQTVCSLDNTVLGTCSNKNSTNSTSTFIDSLSLYEPNNFTSITHNDVDQKVFSPLCPIRSNIKRQKMIYHCKFGEFGNLEGQFTEPSGVAVNAQGDIIVADTNNHRIQIFDCEGRFKFQFGECGKRDGQLLYPNRVAVVKSSGDIVVTERSPTHQIQIYNQYGQFVRKFGADILQHPRGVTVDNKGRIIIVECKVMRVVIFNQMGEVLHKFGCSKYLDFPNGISVNDKHEIFISDNRAHCIKVFSYEGTYLRQIGSEGLTNYPIGVGINSCGELIVADNHNNFNLTIFNQDGTLVSALESKVKHAQCFDVALLSDDSVVLASKDFRIYVYRYSTSSTFNLTALNFSNSCNIAASSIPPNSFISTPLAI